MSGINFAERLVLERKRLGLTATDVWKTTGVHRNSQSYYENGKQEPSIQYLQQLFEMGFDVQYLVTGQHCAAFANSELNTDLSDEQRTVLCAYAAAPVQIRQPLLLVLQASAQR